jgi:hypothetical protein
MTEQNMQNKSPKEQFDSIGEATVAVEFSRLTGLEPLKSYTVIRQQRDKFYRAVTVAPAIDKAYEQALTLPVSAFKEVDPIYAAAFVGLEESHNLVVFESGAEQNIGKEELSWTDKDR